MKFMSNTKAGAGSFVPVLISASLLVLDLLANDATSTIDWNCHRVYRHPSRRALALPTSSIASRRHRSTISHGSMASRGALDRRSRMAESHSSFSPSLSPSLPVLVTDMLERHRRGEELTAETCHTVLAQCVARDEWDAAWELMETIYRERGLAQNRSMYEECIRACLEVSNGVSAAEILRAMSLAGFAPGLTEIGWVVTAICNSAPPLSAYMVALASLDRKKRWQEAMRLVWNWEKKPSSNTSIASDDDDEWELYKSVMEICVSANRGEQAVQVLQSCIQRGLRPSSESFEMIIQALGKMLQWRRALFVMELMDDLAIPRTLVMYNAVISACAKSKEVVQAKSLLGRMRKDLIRPDIFSYNAVLSACASTSHWQDALSILDQCYREPGVTPDIYTYTNAIRACAKGGKTARALSLLQVAQDKGLTIDTYCFTAAIEACAKAKMWKKALDLLHEMETKGIPPSEVTYSVTITACGNGGQWEKALDLLTVMREKNMPINLIAYNSAITALSKAAKLTYKSKIMEDVPKLSTKALDLLEQMKRDGLEPDGFSFSSAISCCGAEGRWQEALEIMQSMREGGPRTQPNRIAFTAAIASCGRAGQVDHAIDLFQQMKEQGLSVDLVAYNALFLAFRVAKRADDASELWREMVGTCRSARTRTDISIAPDIITLTDAIGAMASVDTPSNRERIDLVFEEAVELGIVLRPDTLDSDYDVDLSGMSLPVARAACRYILKHLASRADRDKIHDLTFVTGTGVGRRNENDTKLSTSLRDYVQNILLNEFRPSLGTTIPPLAQGTVVIPKEILLKWITDQSTV